LKSKKKYDPMKRTLFDQLLVEFEIQLPEAMAIRRYASLPEDEKGEIKQANNATQESFTSLDLALQFPHTLCGNSSEHHSKRLEILARCKPAIRSLVVRFGLTQRRDPRRIIASSTYRVDGYMG